MSKVNAEERTPSTCPSPSLSGPFEGDAVSIGSGFSARSFRARDIGAAMDPLILVDDYVMSEDTFGTHPHVGLSAVSLILSDSTGCYRSRDSLGNDVDLYPGDLYWLKAGSGVLHNESPRKRSVTRGLQVFVNVRRSSRFDEPSSRLVRRQDMPVLKGRAFDVRIVLGKSNGVAGAQSPGLPMTILDGEITAGGLFSHTLDGGRNAWIQMIDGDLDVELSTRRAVLQKGQAIAIGNADLPVPATVTLHARHDSPARFVLLDGQAIKEPYVQKGPFALNSIDEFDAVNQAYHDGRFGSIG